MFKQETELVEWFYTALEPMKHYVPVKKDLSDLQEKLEWAKKNDEKVREIAKEATKFVEETLMPDSILSDLVFILTEYSKLQKFVPKKKFPPAFPPDWTAW